MENGLANNVLQEVNMCERDRRSKALNALKLAKEKESKIKDLVSIKIDKWTTLLMSREKAIKKGYITE